MRSSVKYRGLWLQVRKWIRAGNNVVVEELYWELGWALPGRQVIINADKTGYKVPVMGVLHFGSSNPGSLGAVNSGYFEGFQTEICSLQDILVLNFIAVELWARFPALSESVLVWKGPLGIDVRGSTQRQCCSALRSVKEWYEPLVREVRYFVKEKEAVKAEKARVRNNLSWSGRETVGLCVSSDWYYGALQLKSMQHMFVPECAICSSTRALSRSNMLGFLNHMSVREAASAHTW